MRVCACLALAIVFSALTGCAGPDVSLSSSAPARWLPPGASPDDSSVAEYAATGGARLAYVHYRAPKAKTALIYLHGIESHEGWFALAASELQAHGYDVFCLDRRGSGINRENRGFASGHVMSYETLLSDIHAFAETLRGRYASVFVVGLSWGGKLGLAYGLTYPQDIQGLVLITPGLKSLLDVTPADKLKIVTNQSLRPTYAIATPIEPELFTTTPHYLDYIRQDPLRLRFASASFFWQSNKLDGYIRERIRDNRLPIQLYLAGQDRIIDNDGVIDLLGQSGPGTLETVRYPDQSHSIQLDAASRLVDDMVKWLALRERR